MVSFIIAHYHTPELLVACLRSVVQHRAVAGEPTEIIVVDGETQPEHAMLVEEEAPDAQFIGVRRNVGFAGLVNRGLAASRGRHCFVLNADILLRRDSLPALLSVIDNASDIGIAAPKLIGFDGAPQSSRRRFPTLSALLARRTWLGKTRWGRRVLRCFTMDDVPIQKRHDVDWLMGSALFVRREAYEAVGGMDERFFLYFEDVDWCRRMWDNGYRVTFVPSAVVLHYHQRASHSGRGLLDIITNKITRTHIKSALRYFWKWRGVDERGLHSVKSIDKIKTTGRDAD